jgi:hypothetical protein
MGSGPIVSFNPLVRSAYQPQYPLSHPLSRRRVSFKLVVIWVGLGRRPADIDKQGMKEYHPPDGGWVNR